jgi:hypothetical protein
MSSLDMVEQQKVLYHSILAYVDQSNSSYQLHQIIIDSPLNYSKSHYLAILYLWEEILILMFGFLRYFIDFLRLYFLFLQFCSHEPLIQSLLLIRSHKKVVGLKNALVLYQILN